MTDEFTEDLKKLEYRFVQMNEQVSANRRTCTALDERTKGHSVELDGVRERFKDLHITLNREDLKPRMW